VPGFKAILMKIVIILGAALVGYSGVPHGNVHFIKIKNTIYLLEVKIIHFASK